MTPLATRIGLALVYLYPPLILAYDAVLKFCLRDPTISRYVWASTGRDDRVCLWLTLNYIVLILHFKFRVFDP